MKNKSPKLLFKISLLFCLLMLFLCAAVFSQTPTPTVTPTPQEIVDPETKNFDEKFKYIQKSVNEVGKLVNSGVPAERENGKVKAQEIIELSKELFGKLEKINGYAQKVAPKIPNAKYAFQLLLKQSESIGNSRLALYHRKNRDWLNSIKYFQEAIKISQETITNPEFKSVDFFEDSKLTLLLSLETNYSQIASVLVYSLEKPDEALQYIEKSIEFNKQIQENQKNNLEVVTFFKFNEASSLDLKALAYRKLNEQYKSIEILKQNLTILQSLPRTEESQILTLISIGSTYSDLLDYENALIFFNEAMKFAEKTNDILQQSNISTYIGIIYRSLNNEEKAREVFLKNLEFVNSYSFVELMKRNNFPIPIPSEFGNAANGLENGFSEQQITFLQYNEIAGKYFGLKEYDKAILYARKALEIVESINNFSFKPSLMTLIARAYIEKEDWQNALKIYKELIEESSKLATKREFALDLAYLSFVYLKTNQIDLAEKNALLALSTYQSLGANSEQFYFGYSYTLDYLAQIYYAIGNRLLAIFYGKQAVNAIQRERQQLKNLDAESQSGYLKKNEKPYRRLAGWLIAEGRVAEAEQVLQMLKEDELSQFLRRDDKVARELLAKIPPDDKEREALQKFDEIAGEITAIGKQVEELRAEREKYESPEKFPKTGELKDLEAKLEASNITFRKFLENLSGQYFSKKTRTTNNPVDIVSSTQSLLNEIKQPKTVIVSTIIEEKRLNLIVSTSKVHHAHTVNITEEKLNELVAEFRQALQDSSVDPRPLGKKLYDTLFPEGLRKDLAGVNADTIVWSLDGILRYVPTAALWDGEKYLVERYDQAVISLASRQNLKDAPTARNNLKALGVGVSKEANITGLDAQPANFPPLPVVPQELCSIVNDPQKTEFCRSFNSVGVIGGKNLTDEEFTYDNFEFYLGRFPIVHIASHFSLNPGNEGTSYLLLGGKNDTERKLTLSQINDRIGNKFQGTEILTLSACNTGMSAGTKSSGEEVESFAAIAQKLGAKTVISSLWSVADPSTRDLMTEFYSQLQNNPNLSKAKAMRNAQLALLNGKYKTGETPLWRGAEIVGSGLNGQPPFNTDSNAEFAHPFYWSPFVLTGNWK